MLNHLPHTRSEEDVTSAVTKGTSPAFSWVVSTQTEVPPQLSGGNRAALGSEDGATMAHTTAWPSGSNISTTFGASPRAAAPQLQVRTRASSFQVVLKEAGAARCCVPPWLESPVEEEGQKKSFSPSAKTPVGFLPHR